MYVDTGGADPSGLFPHYVAKPDAIESSAEGLDHHAANIQAFSTEIDARHQAALANVSGVIAEPLSTAAQQPSQYSTLMIGRTYVSSGSIRLFGQGVQRFNQVIDQLNEQYRQAQSSDFGVLESEYPEKATLAQKNEIDGARDDEIMEAKVALLRSLVEQYLKAREVLDQDAAAQAAHINAGPTDQTLQDLYAAGALPTSVTLAYPNLSLTTTVLPPDMADLDPEEVEDYLRAHPEVANSVVNGLLTKDGLSDLEQAIVEAQGRIDAELLKEGMSKPPGQDALDDIAAAQTRLQLINDHVAQNGVLNDAAHSYTVAWMNEVGSEDLAKLPNVIQANVQEAFKGAPQDVWATEAQKYLTPVANSIMNLSNEKLQTVTGEEGPGTTSLRYDLNGDGLLDKNDMPKAIRELVDMRIGAGDGLGRYPNGDGSRFSMNGEIENLEAFKGWTDLLEASTVDGGHGFTLDIGEQAIEAKQDINAILATAAQWTETGGLSPEEWNALESQLTDTVPSDLLSVVARNEDASASLLIDEAHRQELLGLNWTDGEGAADVIRAGTDRDPADGGGTEFQATAAMEVMTEIASDPQAYSSAVTNESVSDAVVDVGITWVDTFGENVGSQSDSRVNTQDTDVLGRLLPYSVALSNGDQEAFLEWIASTGDQDAIRFESAAKTYGQMLISDALAMQDDPSLTAEQKGEYLDNALEWAGRADGQMTQATIEWAMDDMETDNERKRADILAQNRSMAAANTAAQIMQSLGTDKLGDVLKGVPMIKPFITVGDALAGNIIDSLLGEEPVLDYKAEEFEVLNDKYETAALDSTARRNYLLAHAALMHDPTLANSPEYEWILNADGSLKTMAEIQAHTDHGNGLDDLESLGLAPINEFNSRQPNGSEVDADQYDQAHDDTFSHSRSDQDRKNDKGWRNDRVAEERLYGDNASRDVGEGSASERYPEDPEDIGKPAWEE